MYVDLFASGLNFDKGGSNDNVTIAANTTIASVSGHFHYNNLTVNTGVTATFSQPGAGAAMVWCDGDVLIQGTVTTSHPFVIPGPTPAVQWDGATSGGNGAAATGGGAGTATTTAVPTSIQTFTNNGRINVTPADYRYKHLFWGWNTPGEGGWGWDTDSATANVAGGLSGGALIIIARGKITIDSATGGTVDCKGQNGTTHAAGFNAYGGGGGGAGGIAILISYREISCLAGALVTVDGGRGGNGVVGANGKSAGGGGGGGSGFYALIAPVVTVGLGSVSALPGLRGTGAVGIGKVLTAGGGGGGGTWGAGGAGGNPALNGNSGFPGGGLTYSGWTAWLGA